MRTGANYYQGVCFVTLNEMKLLEHDTEKIVEKIPPRINFKV